MPYTGSSLEVPVLKLLLHLCFEGITKQNPSDEVLEAHVHPTVDKTPASQRSGSSSQSRGDTKGESLEAIASCCKENDSLPSAVPLW